MSLLKFHYFGSCEMSPLMSKKELFELLFLSKFHTLRLTKIRRDISTFCFNIIGFSYDL